MQDRTRAADNIRAVAAVADLQGHSRESVQLLLDADKALRDDHKDAHLSRELRGWSFVATAKGQDSFATILTDAAELLTP